MELGKLTAVYLPGEATVVISLHAGRHVLVCEALEVGDHHSRIRTAELLRRRGVQGCLLDVCAELSLMEAAELDRRIVPMLEVPSPWDYREIT